jgi:hypothetical protein
MRTESGFPYMSTLGIIFMLPGAFLTAIGITETKTAYIAMGLVLFGFSIYLWIESAYSRIFNTLTEEEE